MTYLFVFPTDTGTTAQRPVPQGFSSTGLLPPLQTLPASAPPQQPAPASRNLDDRRIEDAAPPRSVSSARAHEASQSSRAAANSGHFQCPDSFGFYPHSKSCDKYWACENGTATLKLCGNGLVFDDADSLRENCAYPFSVDCGSRTDLGESASTSNPRLVALSFSDDDCQVSCGKYSGRRFSFPLNFQLSIKNPLFRFFLLIVYKHLAFLSLFVLPLNSPSQLSSPFHPASSFLQSYTCTAKTIHLCSCQSPTPPSK